MSIFKKVDNSAYKSTITIGAGKLKQICWYFVNILFFKNSLFISSAFKVRLLKLFGANVGMGVVIKPSINIKYPWKLSIGDHSWIGEEVWIDNLENVTIEDNCCLSQGCLLLTGSHDAMSETFAYTAASIVLQSGVWIGAKAIVSPGVNCGSHAVLGAGSLADKDLDAYTIYKGNPAIPVLKR